ncbi:unannotated protein [freshwater metagenome]|uniref:Unannotated protein n=1 Tax=freshwater metagenome TaxID=449393 RepID=A0A6J6TDI0_9ZZZZ
MSSAMRSGSCNGTSSAEIDTPMFFVRASTAPAVMSGEGLQPLAAPWCSSWLIAMNPNLSAHSAMSMPAL